MYFGIWIVNTLLRIITLGLYSPWAKVRKRRFFYGNTLLNKANFDYLADPLAILKGWLIGVAAFGAYSLASNTNPIAAAVLMVLFVGLFPWVVVRSHIFNMRNSSHRNVRFGFNADYRGAYRVFLWWQLLIPLTLGIMTPYVLYRQKRFLVENSFYGTTPFSFHATSKDYFRIFRPVFLLALLGAASIGAMFYLYCGKTGTVIATSLLEAAPALALGATYIAVVFAIVVYLPTALANLTWSSTGIGNHRFSLTLRIRDLLWIHFSSAIAVSASLGLLMPWASVRMARYTLGRLTLQGAGDLDYIMAAATAPTGATGEELGDVFGLDFGL